MDCKKPTWATGIFSSLIFFLLSLFFGYGQSNDQREIIRSSNNQQRLAQLMSEFASEQQTKESKIREFQSKGWRSLEKFRDGTVVALKDVGPDGTPLFYTTLNDPTRQTSRAHTLYSNGLLDLGLDGTGMSVGVWDAGVALASHQEFNGRATDNDGSAEVGPHATMVTGHLISQGIKPNAKGVAYGAVALTHNWTRDKIEATEAAANGLLLSNHSYGIKSDRVPDWYFGAYIKVSQDWDKIMYSAPYYLMVTAAGNSQRSLDNETPIYGTNVDGFDLLLGFTTSKNGLTVAGANTKIGGNGELQQAQVASYSSLGPVDDGRIKPDLAGDGSSILSTSSETNTSYDASVGTSLAAPGVTGALLLLQQYHEELFGTYMKAATLKGLALHTADDVDAPGPDYKMGWGVMNAKAAAELLQDKEYSSLVQEERLEQGNTFSLTLKARKNETLTASLSWTDPEGEYINRGEMNNQTTALINDLDIRITKDGETYFPWKLNPSRAGDAAIKGDNLVDPYERIQIENAEGEYTITISHKGGLRDGFQDFSLLVSGAQVSACSTDIPEGLDLLSSNEEGVSLFWNHTDDTLYELQYRAFNEAEWQSNMLWESQAELSNLAVGQIYEARLRSICTESAVSEFSDEIQFEFKGEETELMAYETLDVGEELHLTVFPNPAVERITVDAKLSEFAQYSIVTTAGNIIKKGKVRGAIDVSCLA
ncbi:MAG: S8 family serine peptidase, partial [Bacteroidota bacterium]